MSSLRARIAAAAASSGRSCVAADSIRTNNRNNASRPRAGVNP